MGTGFPDRANLDVWHLTPRTGPEYVPRVGVKQQGPFQVPSAEAEGPGSLVMPCPQGLGLGVLLPLSPYGTRSSSLSLTVQRALRHTQAPGGPLLGMHRPACVPASGPRSINTPDCPEPFPDLSLLLWQDLGAWGTSSLLFLSASSAVDAHGQQAGIQPCSAVLDWVPSPQGWP